MTTLAMQQKQSPLVEFKFGGFMDYILEGSIHEVEKLRSSCMGHYSQQEKLSKYQGYKNKQLLPILLFATVVYGSTRCHPIRTEKYTGRLSNTHGRGL